MKKNRMCIFLLFFGLYGGLGLGVGVGCPAGSAACRKPAGTVPSATSDKAPDRAGAVTTVPVAAGQLGSVAAAPVAAGWAGPVAVTSVTAGPLGSASPVTAPAATAGLLHAATAVPVAKVAELAEVSRPAAPPVTYRNPVVPYSLPDPSVIRADDGYFYLYATEDIRNLPIHRSKDLVHWEQVGTAFTDRSRPDFEPGAGIWAPDINRIGDRYVLYYSLSVWGGEWTCGIGCATSDRPESPFCDEGMMMRSNQIGVQNSIDPFYIEEGGEKFLFWGSFRGIYGVRLTDDGLRVGEGEKPRRVAGTAYEGTYIHKKEGYYYLFASTGTCCEGLKSTYTTVVGRSQNLFGPYVDKAGRPMLENHHEVLIGKNDAFVGTGHNSEIVTDSLGRDWLFYHAVDTERPEGRVLMLDRIDWTEGWPSVAGSVPSLEAEAPVF